MRQNLSQEEEKTWRDSYALFTHLFRGRDDVIAEHCNGEYVSVEGAGLTFERFLDHVSLEKTYAVYNKDDAGMVRFGLFDVDVVQRSDGWAKVLPFLDEKKRETSRIIQTLLEMGLEQRNLLIEFPTVGFHLFLFFDGPVPAKDLKTLMGFILKRAGLPTIPFYPRKVDGSRWGDRVQLPLRINRNTSRRSNFVRDLESFDPKRYDDNPDFTILHDIVPIDAQWVSKTMSAYGIAL
jgi:hypothetical protein